jgi:16S rRNA (guanine966-N2)-methyltransferase
VLLDPPYDTGAGQVAVDKLTRLGWIGEGTWVSLETAKGETVTIKGFEADATRDVGKARLHLLRRTS